MSYKLLSFHTGEEHDLCQWENRSIEGEIEGAETRTIVPIFEKYLSGKKVRIMEGGCGIGSWCEWFQERGHDAVGIEYNEEIVNKAKKFKPDVKVELGDVTDLQHPDNSFDAYISLGVVEHFENGPQQALKEAHRILKPGGLAFISVPYLTVLRRLISHPVRSVYFLLRKLKNQPNYFWEYRYTKNELKRYLEEAGFEIVEAAVEDYEPYEKNRHVGLWADWFFLRKLDGEIWELNSTGKLILKLLKIFPRSWYCSGILIVARAKKNEIPESINKNCQKLYAT
jgi:SAM-dependent methyltransferase